MTHLRYLATLAVVLAAAPAGASAATYSVSPTGKDNFDGSPAKPFATITRAAEAATSGDVVLVSSGRYPETVPLSSRNSGVIFRGTGTTRPVIDGEGVRSRGFDNMGASNLTIQDFELTGQTEAGIFTAGSNNTVSGNVIHHVGSPSVTHSQGVRVNRGSGNRVVGNTIHHVGPGSESMGIWLVESRDAMVEENTVYLVRKEGMRDWKGLDNTLRRNRSYLNWVGISLATSTGSNVVDNLVYENTQGIVAKHTSYSRVLDYWGLPVGRWSTVTHNTVFRSTEASMWVAQSDDPLDYLDVRENAFSGAGTAFLRDAPTLRSLNVRVDSNSYSDVGGKPRWLYKAGYSSDPGLLEWSLVRSLVGWELNAAPADAGSRDVAVAEPAWTPYKMTPVDSSSKGTYYTNTHLNKTSDNDQSTYWLTSGNKDEYVAFDFGQHRTFNHLNLTLFRHDDLRNPRGVRFEVWNGTSWQTVHESTNADPAGAAHTYELDAPATARFLRFTMLDTFCSASGECGEYFVMSDLEAGLLGPQAVPFTAQQAPAEETQDTAEEPVRTKGPKSTDAGGGKGNGKK